MAPNRDGHANHGHACVKGRFAFGYISNLDHPRENQELLIAATAILLRKGRAVTCLIV